MGERQVLQYDNTGVREDGILGDIEVRGYGTVRGLRDTGIRKIYDEGKYTTKQNRPGFENIEVRVATRTWEYNDTSLKISMYFRTVHLCFRVHGSSCRRVPISSHLPIPLFPSLVVSPACNTDSLFLQLSHRNSVIAKLRNANKEMTDNVSAFASVYFLI